MKPRLLITLLALLLVAVGVLWVFNRVSTPIPTASADNDPDVEALRKRFRRPFSDAVRPLPGPSTGAVATNRLSRLARLMAGEDMGEEFMLTREQVDAYLVTNRRSAESLLAAAQLAHDPALLREAAEKFPNDPRVQFAMLTVNSNKLALSPEERRKWLEAFKQSSPDNALPGLLAAREYFKANQPQDAVREVSEALARRGYRDFTLEAGQNLEEAYLSAGYSVAEAKTIAMSSVLLPQMSELKQVGVALADMEKQYRAAGDIASADRLFTTGLQTAQLLTDERSPTLIQELVGMAIERRMLTNYSASQPTVQQQLAELDRRRQAIREVTSSVNVEVFFQSSSDADIISYWDRVRVYGEYNAMLWLKQRQTNAP